MNAIRCPAARAASMAGGRLRHRRVAHVDHPVEVEQRHVVGAAPTAHRRIPAPVPTPSRPDLYDAPMESSEAVTPPYLATPLQLEPFRALMLAPYRVGDAGAGRAFARPYREVAGRLRRWEAAGRVIHDAEPAVYLHEYTSGGITVRGLVGALDMSRRATDLAERAVLPHEGIHPHRAHDLADHMLEMRLNPAPILLVHRGPEEVRSRGASPARDRARSSVLRPGGAAAPPVGAPGRPVADRHPCPGRQPPADRRRPPPVRGLPPAAAGATGHGLGPRAGHARRPGRHPAVPRRHPPGAARGAAGRPR